MAKQRSLSIRQKLLLSVITCTLAALVITGIAMMAYDLRSYQQSLVTDMLTQADLLGRAGAPALEFDDHKSAQQALLLLKARPQISAAAIYTAKGALFSSYLQDAQVGRDLPQLPEADGYRIEGKNLAVFKRVVDNGEIQGTVYLRAHYELFERLKDYLAILLAAIAVSLLAAVLLSQLLNSLVVKPVLAIDDVARRIMSTRDFSLRAAKTTEDEIGSLADAFNDMLDEIGRRAAVLQESNQRLGLEVGERAEAEAALRASDQRMRTLVAATTSIVWTADAKGHFTGESPSWAQYTGQAFDTYQGSGWRAAFHPDDRQAIELAWAHAIDAAKAFDIETRLWQEGAQRHRFVGVRGVPIVDENGGVLEWIGTIADLDDQRLAEAELKKLNAELERRVQERTSQLESVNKELEGFSYSVSHDLRAPLRAVVGFAKLLEEDHTEQLDEEARRKLSIIQSEATRMSVLIDELLAFSRLGRQAMQPQQLDMKALASGMYNRLQPQSGGPKADFRLGTLPSARGDRVLLEQVWANFISNALKFSSKREEPVIEIGAVSDGAEHIYFVRDNGAGFDPKYQSKLFGVFQRLHDASDFAGTGVGLALVERIVTRHGGRVWADSKPDEGATFYFTLPKEVRDGTN